jgi:hypothetical protein
LHCEKVALHTETKRKKVKIMRTKTVLLSALLGALSSVAVHAQNVYSINAVGYINVVLYPGFNMISCPLITSNSSIASLFPNNPPNGQQYGSGGPYYNVFIFQWNGTTMIYDQGDNTDFTSGTNGWDNNGVITMNPGQAVWFLNPNSTNMTNTFVGTVPTGTLTNTLSPGFNMVSSIVPLTGDVVTNMNLTNFNNGDINNNEYQDTVFVYSGTAQSFLSYQVQGSSFGGFGYDNQWVAPGDPQVTNVSQGFWYLNTGPTIHWVENYSVSQ